MKKILAVSLCLSLGGLLAAADIGTRLKELLPEQIVAELISKGAVQNSVYRIKGASPKIAPANALAQEALSFWAGAEPPFFVETLFLYKKADARQGAPGCDLGAVSRILRSISGLEGVEYYSNSRKKMRTLYDKSYVVDGATTRRKVPDPVDGSADGLALFALQKDLTFGEYLYSYRYRETGDAVAFFSANVDPMSYSIIRILDPDNLRVSLVVQDLGDYFLVYNLTRANFFAVPGIEDKMNKSFTARTDAVYSWFLKEYEKH